MRLFLDHILYLFIVPAQEGPVKPELQVQLLGEEHMPYVWEYVGNSVTSTVAIVTVIVLTAICFAAIETDVTWVTSTCVGSGARAQA